MAADPKTLLEAVQYFTDADNCLNFLKVRRWPDGVAVCPTCGSTNVSFLPSRRLWQCKTRHPKAQFSIKVGTIFEDSPLGLDKWLPAMWMIANDRNGISSWELHRALGVTQKTAWFMLHRIRLAMHEGFFRKLDGTVEVDETFIGGKARNMHAKVRRSRAITAGRPKYSTTDGKMIVMGLLERNGRVRAKVVKNTKRATLQGEIEANVESGATVYTDDFQAYAGMDSEYFHAVINHAEKYVDGAVHTNGIENFRSLLKRSIGGTYVSVEPFHLFRYIDEQAYRFNNRNMNDFERFSFVVRQIVGKRLTYKELIGQTEEQNAETSLN